jgi:hypothetical protein
MDEQREAQEELAAIERETVDEAREQAHVWTDNDGLEWAQHVGAETERWSR